MSNTITIELCAEDRARLDKLATLMEQRASQAETFLEVVATTEEVAELTAEPLATPKEEPKAEANPVEEVPQQSELEPENIAPVEKAEPAVTLEQIQQKVVQLAAAGAEKKAKAREIISVYGTKVSDLKNQPEKWGEVWQKLTALEG